MDRRSLDLNMHECSPDCAKAKSWAGLSAATLAAGLPGAASTKAQRTVLIAAAGNSTRCDRPGEHAPLSDHYLHIISRS
jgi:hypothetical protein